MKIAKKIKKGIQLLGNYNAGNWQSRRTHHYHLDYNTLDNNVDVTGSKTPKKLRSKMDIESGTVMQRIGFIKPKLEFKEPADLKQTIEI